MVQLHEVRLLLQFVELRWAPFSSEPPEFRTHSQSFGVGGKRREEKSNKFENKLQAALIFFSFSLIASFFLLSKTCHTPVRNPFLPQPSVGSTRLCYAMRSMNSFILFEDIIVNAACISRDEAKVKRAFLTSGFPTRKTV
jgi:hypothetical protein